MILQLGETQNSNFFVIGIILAVIIVNAGISSFFKKNIAIKVSTRKVVIIGITFIAALILVFFWLNRTLYTISMGRLSYIMNEVLQGKLYNFTSQTPSKLLFIVLIHNMSEGVGDYSIIILNICFMFFGCIIWLKTSFLFLANNESRVHVKRSLLITMISAPAILFFSDAEFFNALSFFLLSAIVYAITSRKTMIAGVVLGISLLFSSNYFFIIVALFHVMGRRKDPELGRFIFFTAMTAMSIYLIWYYQVYQLFSNFYYILTSLGYFFPAGILFPGEPSRFTILETIIPSYTSLPLYPVIVPISWLIISIATRDWPKSPDQRNKTFLAVLPMARLFPLLFQVEYSVSCTFPILFLLCLKPGTARDREDAPLIQYINVLVLLEFVIAYIIPQWAVVYFNIETVILIAAFSYSSFERWEYSPRIHQNNRLLVH